MLGFKFNNIHSSTFGLCIQSKNRPILPPPRIITESLSGMDGVYDFSTANPFKRILYDNREISVDCSFISNDFATFRSKARDIAKWLAVGTKVLEFDDEHNIFYNATVVNKLDLSQQIKRGHFTIIFSCSPFANSPILIDSGFNDLPINCFMLTSNQTITVINYGTFVRPLIVVDGTYKNIRFEYEDKSLSFLCDADGQLLVDCKLMTAKYNLQNALSMMSGDFFELKEGNNTVNVTADSINAQIYFVFYPTHY